DSPFPSRRFTVRRRACRGAGDEYEPPESVEHAIRPAERREVTSQNSSRGPRLRLNPHSRGLPHGSVNKLYPKCRDGSWRGRSLAGGTSDTMLFVMEKKRQLSNKALPTTRSEQEPNTVNLVAVGEEPIPAFARGHDLPAE